ncbi:hypothetical protein L9F63_005041 [Diploptera punctata]|uniref:Uncharacterized protein n=1 Tax=Diploptera punctata TaxID=6984 RepID=A0AAD7ZED4_DIPPU|nr:hypothetical protein L9F63_005041 [Diploptera punctata]
MAIDFFPNKLPKRFMGCVLNIGAMGLTPDMIKESYTSENGENKFAANGLTLELINLFVKEMKMTPYFQEPIDGTENDRVFTLIGMLMTGEIDILTGEIPLIHPALSLGEPSAPMFISTLKFLVPCPKPLMKTEKMLHLFTLSSWISMGLVFTFVSVLFWILSNYPIRRNDFTAFSLLAQCFSGAWAVLLGNSVPQMPLSLGTRTLFIIYVWYCFAITTVFQAFFTTYLVEPGFEARLKNLDDVRRAGLKYVFFPTTEAYQKLVDIDEVDAFEKEYFSDILEGYSSVMFKRNTFMTSQEHYPSYLARLSGFDDEGNVVCYLDESIVTWPIGALLTKGHPLLQIINLHITRCIEGGLLEAYWTKLKHETNLKANTTEKNSEYVVFCLMHLFPMFILLSFGYILSTFSFLCELILFRMKSKRIGSLKFKELRIFAELRILDENK